ncbi:MAG: AsmA-like C-terminal region-containing protein [Saprospiraceae bacterium]|nr:AsmA-like C-terminal region-containing protein [Saprospiraceae bacterium]
MALTRYVTWAKRLFISFILLLVSLYLLAWIFEDKLGQMALDLVREEVSTKVEVGEFHLSFIRAFPRIRGAFQDVYIEGSDGDTLLTCETLGLHMGWSTLWSDEIALDALIVEEGRLNIHFNKKGEGNYDIFAPSDQKSDAPVRLDIRKARIQQLLVHYHHDQDNLTLDYLIDNGTIKGKWQAQTIQLDEELAGQLILLQSGKDTLVQDLPVNATGPLAIHLETNLYELAGTELQLDNVHTQVKGRCELGTKDTYLDLDLQAVDQPVGALWSLVSRQMPITKEPLDPTGMADFNLTIKGVSKANRLPEMKASLQWKDGQLRRAGDKVEDVNLAVSWEQPAGKKSDNSVITIRSLDATYTGEPFHLEGTIRQPADAIVDLKAHGRMPITLLQTELVSGQEGTIHFHDVVIKGKLSRNDLQASGRAELQGVLLTYQGDLIAIPSGTVELDQDHLGVRQLEVDIAGNTLILHGDIKGFLAQFRDQASPVPIRFDGRVHSRELNAFALMEQFQKWQKNQPEAQATAVAASSSGSASFTRYNGTLHAEIGSFTWEDIKGKDFTGSVSLDGRTMLISGDAQAMGGTLNLEGELNWGQKTVWDGALTCEEVDVEEAFRQCHNFGQTFITGKQIKGSLSTQLLFNAEWDARGNFIPENLHVYSAIQMEDGEIQDLDVLESFSDYIHVKDLEHVRFSTLQNYLEVVDGMVYLPKMTIRSNALVLDVTGLHGFDQKIDYGLRVDAGQVLINKITRHDVSLAPKPARENGWFNLYYHLSGTVDDYVYKSNRDRVRDDFVRSQFHRNRIRAALTEEFGKLLFDDDLEEEAPVAERPQRVSLGDVLNLPIGTSTPIRTRSTLSTSKPVGKPVGKSDGEYLDDFEIEGGGAKKKKD